MSYYIYSTLSQDMSYTTYANTGGDLQIPVSQIHIRGGAGVVDNKTLVTPLGARTEITEEDYLILRENHVFKQHVKNGFIVVLQSKQKIEKTVREHLNPHDESAQKTPDDFERMREQGVEGNRPAAIATKK